MIARRQTLLGAATLAAVGLPKRSHASIHPLSPILPITTNPSPNLLRTKLNMTVPLSEISPFDIPTTYSGIHGPMHVASYFRWRFESRDEICSTSIGRQVDSVYEAEDILLNAVKVFEFKIARHSPSKIIEWQCETINAKAGRGNGNIILINAETLDKLIKLDFIIIGADDFSFVAEPDTIGRWTKCAISNNITIYTSNHMPDMEVVTLYRGSERLVGDKWVHDAGAVLVQGENGLTLIDDVYRPDLGSYPFYGDYPVSAASTYFTRFRIVE